MAEQHPELVEKQYERARVRRSPRYGIFLALGAGLGILAALVLTFAFDAGREESVTGVTYTTSQVFGFLLLGCIPVGMVVTAAVALLLDRLLSRRTHDVAVEHDRIFIADDDTPAADAD